MLATSAPWSAAHRMPLKMALNGPEPVRPSTLTPISVTPEVMPAAASALLLTVAATCVPWKWRSVTGLRVGKSAATMASSLGLNDLERARSTRPFRSAWR